MMSEPEATPQAVPTQAHAADPSAISVFLRRRPAFTARWVLAIVSVGISLVAILVVLIAAFRWSHITVVGDLPFNEPIKLAVELRLEQSGKCFDYTVLLMAAILGLFIAKPGEGRVLTSDRPEIILCTATCVMIGLTLLLNHSFTGAVRDALLAGGLVQGSSDAAFMPDVVSGSFDQMYRGQWWALICAWALSAITLFSAHRLRE